MTRGRVGVGKCVRRVTEFRESNGRPEKTHLPRQCNKLIIKKKNKNKKIVYKRKNLRAARANERGGGKKVTLCVCSRRGHRRRCRWAKIGVVKGECNFVMNTNCGGGVVGVGVVARRQRGRPVLRWQVGGGVRGPRRRYKATGAIITCGRVPRGSYASR